MEPLNWNEDIFPTHEWVYISHLMVIWKIGTDDTTSDAMELNTYTSNNCVFSAWQLQACSHGWGNVLLLVKFINMIYVTAVFLKPIESIINLVSGNIIWLILDECHFVAFKTHLKVSFILFIFIFRSIFWLKQFINCWF